MTETRKREMHATDLYFECHITIEPVFGVDLEKITVSAAKYGFKAADLLMVKRVGDSPERSKFDTFLTGRGGYYTPLQSRMCSLIEELKSSGFKVWRYKIEDTLIDSNVKDSLGIL